MESPLRKRRKATEAKAIVPDQVLWRFGHAVLCDVSRRGTQYPAMVTQFFGYQPAVVQLSDSDRRVKTFIDDVDQTLAIVSDDRDMRMSLEKLRQHRAKPTPAHGCRQCKAQSTADFAGALGRLLLRFIHQFDG
ncbi:hypothetical protein D3C72_1340040 [compost metagenome]